MIDECQVHRDDLALVEYSIGKEYDFDLLDIEIQWALLPLALVEKPSFIVLMIFKVYIPTPPGGGHC